MSKQKNGNGSEDSLLNEVDVLKEATESLRDLTQNEEKDKEEIGSWITVIGRALLAIFKGI